MFSGSAPTLFSKVSVCLIVVSETETSVFDESILTLLEVPWLITVLFFETGSYKRFNCST